MKLAKRTPEQVEARKTVNRLRAMLTDEDFSDACRKAEEAGQKMEGSDKQKKWALNIIDRHDLDEIVKDFLSLQNATDIIENARQLDYLASHRALLVLGRVSKETLDLCNLIY